MVSGEAWSRHYLHVWQERAAHGRHPLWLRISFLAMGTHRANGHARFKPGELAQIFGGGIDPDTGEIKVLDKRVIWRAIRAAIEAGWLAEGSSSMCLIVPAHAISGGLGSAEEPCPIHQRKRRARARKVITQ